MRVMSVEERRPDVPLHIDWTVRPKKFEYPEPARANVDAVAAMLATRNGIEGDSDLDGHTTLQKYRALAAWVDVRQADFDEFMRNTYGIKDPSLPKIVPAARS